MPNPAASFDNMSVTGDASIAGNVAVGEELRVKGITDVRDLIVRGALTLDNVKVHIANDMMPLPEGATLPTGQAVQTYFEPIMGDLRAALEKKADRHGAPDTAFQTGDLDVRGGLILRGFKVAGIASSLDGAAETALPTVSAVTLYVAQQSAALGKHLTAVEETVAAIPRIAPERVDELSSRLDTLETRIAELSDMFDRLVKANADGMRQLEERVEDLAKELQSEPLPPEKVPCPNCGEELEVPAKLSMFGIERKCPICKKTYRVKRNLDGVLEAQDSLRD